MTEAGKEVAKYADESMFKAEPTEGHRPRVTLIHANNDPLGQLAQLAMMYQGKSVRHLSEISDADRRYYFQDNRKNILGMPSEAIMFHFLIENVSRSITHQLVRTRHASFAQESMRFAVKEDFPTALSPAMEKAKAEYETLHHEWFENEKSAFTWDEYLERFGSKEVKRYRRWRNAMQFIEQEYMFFIDDGMPAEDARDLAPHGILTKLNMVITLRSLMNMAGQRLCTQAQWPHRQIWDAMLQAIRDYGRDTNYEVEIAGVDPGVLYSRVSRREWPYDMNIARRDSSWQFELIADQFLPVCYQTGRCQFRSDFDRYCNIRDRVEAFAAAGVPSTEWHKDYAGKNLMMFEGQDAEGIPAIHPAEWLHPNAAIQPTGDWRSEEAKENIKDRRL